MSTARTTSSSTTTPTGTAMYSTVVMGGLLREDMFAVGVVLIMFAGT